MLGGIHCNGGGGGDGSKGWALRRIANANAQVADRIALRAAVALTEKVPEAASMVHFQRARESQTEVCATSEAGGSRYAIPPYK